MDIEHYRIPAGNRLVIINRQNSSVWANLWVNARRGIAHADITTLSWKGKTIAGALAWARKQLWDSEDYRDTSTPQWPYLNAYTLRATDNSSAMYGPCEVCKKHAAEVFIQRHLVLNFNHPGWQNQEGPPSPFYIARPAIFGHKKCLLRIRNHDLHPFFVSDPT